MLRQANLPKYVSETRDALTRAGLAVSVLPRSLKHPLGPRIRIPIKKNVPVLRGIEWDAEERKLPRRTPSEYGVTPTARALITKIYATNAGRAVRQSNRAVSVSLAEKNKNDSYAAFHVTFPRKCRLF